MYLTRSATVLVLTLGAAFPAIAADVANGKRIAQRWCASCHVVAPDQSARASADVPSFAAIAAKYEDPKALTTFLTAPYPRMPNMTLSQPEIADLVAYIRTLGPPRPEPKPGDKDEKVPEPHRG